MGKKRNKSTKQKSARGHKESLTYRYRERKLLIPVDAQGNPIDDSGVAPPYSPVIPSERRKLAQAMLDQTGSSPPEDAFSPPEPELPANVVSLCQRRAAEVQQPATDSNTKAANEVGEDNVVDAVSYYKNPDAQATINYDRIVYHQWANRTSLYVSKREEEALELRRLSEYCAAHPNGKNPRIGSLIAPDELPKHKAISIVHNPGLSSKPIEHGGYAVPETQQQSKPVTCYNQQARAERGDNPTLAEYKVHNLAPSGRPMTEFLEGGKCAPKQEQQSPVVQPVRQRSKNTAPFGLIATPTAWAAEDQLRTMINMVSEQHWPKQLEPYLFKDGDTWHIHTGKVRQSISGGYDRIISRAVALALIQHTKDVDEHIGALECENSFLHQENKLISYELAQHKGDDETIEQLRREGGWKPQGSRHTSKQLTEGFNAQQYATAYPKPPKETSKLVAEFKQFTSHVQHEGLSKSYSRFMYGSTEPAERMEAEVQRRMQYREQTVADAKAMARLVVLFNQVPTMLEIAKQRAWVAKRRKPMLTDEVAALKRFRRHAAKAKSEDKLYYSGLTVAIVDRKSIITTNGRVVEAPCEFVRPVGNKLYLPTNSSPLRVDNSWMNSARAINKMVGCQHWSNSNPKLIDGSEYWTMKYQPVEPTVLLEYRAVVGKSAVYNDTFDKRHVSDARISWWNDQAEACELRYMKGTTVGKMIFPISRAIKKLYDIGQTNIDPWSRKKDREAQAERLRKKSLKAEQRAVERQAKADAAHEADEIYRQKQRAKALYRAVN